MAVSHRKVLCTTLLPAANSFQENEDRNLSNNGPEITHPINIIRRLEKQSLVNKNKIKEKKNLQNSKTFHNFLNSFLLPFKEESIAGTKYYC
jgi:hypothetical protein